MVNSTLFSFPQQLRRNENRLEELQCARLMLMPAFCRNATHWHSAHTETATENSRAAKSSFRLIPFIYSILIGYESQLLPVESTLATELSPQLLMGPKLCGINYDVTVEQKLGLNPFMDWDFNFKSKRALCRQTY